MKILITADPFIPVPPPLYGGIERVIHMLIDGYVRLGHEVHLIAHRDSRHPSLAGRFSWPHEEPRGFNHVQNALELRHAVNRVDPDVIQSFSRLQYLLALKRSTRAFMLQCYQREVTERRTRAASWLFGPNRLQFSACGRHMIKSEWAQASRWHTVHNCTDTTRLTPIKGKAADYFVFLGRIEPIKGIEDAILLAKRTRTPLRIAGNIEPEHQGFFNDHVLPHIDGDRITYVGAVDDRRKHELLTGAKAFLMLIRWEEPFGIVMAEALSCGVPVLALERGSVPEIVQNGRNGFSAKSLEGLIPLVGDLDKISRDDCRLDALRRFSVDVIAQQYLDIFSSNARM